MSPYLRSVAAHGWHGDAWLRARRRPGRRGAVLVSALRLGAVAHLHRSLLRRVLLGVLPLDALDFFLAAHLNLEQLRAHIAARRRHHRHENVVPLLLAFLFPIALPVTSSTNALAQVLHAGRMRHPRASPF